MANMNFDDFLASRPEAVRVKAEKRYRELRAAFPLAELRNASCLSQADMAGLLGTSQAAVSKMEARSDMLLSSVFRYVSALGGEAHLSVRLNEEEFQFVPEHDDCLAFRLRREERLEISPAIIYASADLGHNDEEDVCQSRYREFWLHDGRSARGGRVSDEINFLCANDQNYQALEFGMAA
ncbi:XRE family transcriptional regulator [Stenotrophomonas humi]|uniref:XRE family transcriptional regulator n=1 Tax=Stenotrophomonas humi TaxID=405444 RepID=UPI001B80D4EF|nr:XRE family transcriptional regulator [Stenotrophomonas humi]